MSAITLVLLVVILIVLFSLNSFVREYFGRHQMEILKIRTALDELKIKLNNLESQIKQPSSLISPPSSPQEEPPVASSKVAQQEKSYLEYIIEKQEAKARVAETPIEEDISEDLEIEEESYVSPQTEPEVRYSPPVEERRSTLAAKAPEQSFFSKYPDLERFVGENLINKIGIIILVLGIAFFVKYAIDQNWINEIGRVAIGVLCAGLLIGVAHKLHKEYKPFSSVLIGGGLATLYFTITLAYHTEGYPLYHQQATSFVILVFITLFAVFLSIAYDRMEIAILAILGGFGSPLMLSSGEGNYVVLFTYLTLLNIGMLVLSYYKKWRAINLVSFACTAILFGAWLFGKMNEHQYDTFIGAFCFATGFYVIFFFMNILYNLKHSSRFEVADISLLLSNTVIYFSFSMMMLARFDDGSYKGLFSIFLALFNFVFAFFVYKRQKADLNLFYLLIGLVLTFVTLAVPLQLKGNYITLFWSVESVLLLWLSQKSGFKVISFGSFVVAGLMFFSLVIDWTKGYNTDGFSTPEYTKQLGFIINKMFITTLVAGGALLATIRLLRHEKFYIFDVELKEYRSVVFIGMLIVFYFGGFLEVNYQAFHYFVEQASRSVSAITYNALFILGLMVLANRIKENTFSGVIAFVSAVFIAFFLITLSTIFSKSTLHHINKVENFSNILLVFRWISIAAVYILAFLFYRVVRFLNENQRNQLYQFTTAFMVFTVIYILSADLDTLGLLITRNVSILEDTQRAGYAVLWGMSGFVLLILGMKWKEKFVRILSLVLFAITIIKLVVYDLANISEGGKILAFILLGVLLLVMSFMYQKVKKLVVDDGNVSEKAESTTINN